jgi:P-type Cu2+ transporter
MNTAGEWTQQPPQTQSERATQEQALKLRLRIEGMHCAACAATVERVLLAVSGVHGATVDAPTGRAIVSVSARQTQALITLIDQALQSAGYRMTGLAEGDPTVAARAQERQMLWRWLVAGFCSMQVMMYTWPSYGALPGDIDLDSDRLLRWASWVLTLPVLLFSAQPFWLAAWRDLRHGRISMDLPVALGIAVAFLASTVAVWAPQSPWGSHLYLDAVTMLVFILLSGRWLEARLRTRTMGVLDDLAESLPSTAHRLQDDGDTHTVAAALLKVGDVVRIRPGERVPVDGLVLRGHSSANEALLSGEASPVVKKPGHRVTAGSLNIDGVLDVQVEKLGQDTRFRQIVDLMNSCAMAKPDWVTMADRWAQPFLWCVLMAALTAGLYWGVDDPSRGLRAAITVLVVTCPCALALAAPAALMASMGSLAKEGVLLRTLSVLEKLATVNHVVFDKTGTLTDEQIASLGIRSWRGLSQQQALQMAAAIAQYSTHLISQAILRQFQDRDLTDALVGITRVQEYPGLGIEVECVHHLTTGTDRGVGQGRVVLRFGSLSWLAQWNESISAEVSQIEADSAVGMADQDGILACFTWKEALRPDAKLALAELGRQGIDVSVCSGDRKQAVMRVTQELGLQESHSKFACGPQEKLAYLSRLKDQGIQVAMVGDGINDAPVLAAAQASFSFAGASGLAQLHADVILLSPTLLSVGRSVRLAKRCIRIMRQNLVWAALYNVVCVPLAWMGYLPPWLASLGMTVSSLLVLANSWRLRSGDA